jgi:hypothetical protein
MQLIAPVGGKEWVSHFLSSPNLLRAVIYSVGRVKSSLLFFSFASHQAELKHRFWLINSALTLHREWVTSPSNRVVMQNIRYSSIYRGEPSKDFYMWFCGFTDGEGCFHIAPTGDKYFVFKFIIDLHVDDSPALEFIHKTLGLGKVITTDKGRKSRFIVQSQKEIMEIIKIFSLYPLQSIKFINFIKFKEAFELYVSYNSTNSREDLNQKINEFRSSMNRGITNYLMPEGKIYQITPHWLLGFIEGEASFAVIKTKLRLVFNIAQSGVDSALLEAIRDYFHSFKGVNQGRYADNLVANISIYTLPPLASPEVRITKPEGKLYIYNLDFFNDHLIPWLDSLTWHTKKEKDYQDFKSILKLKSMGLHHTEEGVRVINLILSQMNSRRLSTNDLKIVDRALLYTQIEKLLKGPSNYVKKEDGRVYIISLNKYHTGGTRKPLILTLKDSNGCVISTFSSRSECAKFLGVSDKTVTIRMQKGEVFLFKGQCVSLSKGVQD